MSSTLGMAILVSALWAAANPAPAPSESNPPPRAEAPTPSQAEPQTPETPREQPRAPAAPPLERAWSYLLEAERITQMVTTRQELSGSARTYLRTALEHSGRALDEALVAARAQQNAALALVQRLEQERPNGRPKPDVAMSPVDAQVEQLSRHLSAAREHLSGLGQAAAPRQPSISLTPP